MMEAAGDVGDVFMSFVLCYWPCSNRLEPLDNPSGDVASALNHGRGAHEG